MTDLQFSISAAYSCIRHPTLAPCHACGEGCRHLFAVNGGEGAAEARLVDGILRAQAEAVTRRLGSRAAEQVTRLQLYMYTVTCTVRIL